MFEDTSKKLDRELKQQEIEFLKWVYEEHSKEQKQNKFKMRSS